MEQRVEEVDHDALRTLRQCRNSGAKNDAEEDESQHVRGCSRLDHVLWDDIEQQCYR